MIISLFAGVIFIAMRITFAMSFGEFINNSGKYCWNFWQEIPLRGVIEWYILLK